jgi:hypothetical protein
MTLMRARTLLVSIFLCCLVVECFCILIVYTKGAISSNDVTTLLVKMLEIYSVPLAVILGGIFARPAKVTLEGGIETAPSTAFWVSVAVAIVWNALLLWRGVGFSVAAFRLSIEDNVSFFSSYLDSISKASSFLVAGALAYFFSKT